MLGVDSAACILQRALQRSENGKGSKDRRAHMQRAKNCMAGNARAMQCRMSPGLILGDQLSGRLTWAPESRKKRLASD